MGEYTQSCLPLGELLLDFNHLAGEIMDYYRALNLEVATLFWQYTIGNIAFIRESVISVPDQVVVMRLLTSLARLALQPPIPDS